MANCELSNLGVEFGDKIKGNEQLAGGLGVGEEPLFPERSFRETLGTKRADKGELNIGSVFLSQICLSLKE